MKMKQNDYLFIAMNNLKTAQKTLQIEEYDATAFYSQQCIEKALKFLLETSKVDMDLKTHNLRTLYRKVETLLPNIKKYKTYIGDISDFYFNSRYPGEDFYIPTKIEAQDAFITAQAVFNMVYNLVENKNEFPNALSTSTTSLFNN